MSLSRGYNLYNQFIIGFIHLSTSFDSMISFVRIWILADHRLFRLAAPFDHRPSFLPETVDLAVKSTAPTKGSRPAPESLGPGGTNQRTGGSVSISLG